MRKRFGGRTHNKFAESPMIEPGWDDLEGQDFGFLERVRQCGRICEPFAFDQGRSEPFAPALKKEEPKPSAIPYQPAPVLFATRPLAHEDCETIAWIVRYRLARLSEGDHKFIIDLYNSVLQKRPVEPEDCARFRLLLSQGV